MCLMYCNFLQCSVPAVYVVFSNVTSNGVDCFEYRETLFIVDVVSKNPANSDRDLKNMQLI